MLPAIFLIGSLSHAGINHNDVKIQSSGNLCKSIKSSTEVTCRALTEKYMLGLKNKARHKIIQEMGTEGRKIPNGLQFFGYYPDGQNLQNVVLDLIFDSKGRVKIITALINMPGYFRSDMLGQVNLIWNRKLLPEGCSDLPGSNLQSCDNL